MDAETAYLFRHALLRDAAYDLQPLTERAALHGLALALIPEVLRAADLPGAAFDLAGHARLALPAAGTDQARSELLGHEHAYLTQAAAYFRRGSQGLDEARVLDLLAAHEATPAHERPRHLLGAARALIHAGTLSDAEARIRASLQDSGARGDDQASTRAQVMLQELLESTGRLEIESFDLENLVQRAAFDADLQLHAMHALGKELTRQGKREQAALLLASSSKLARQARVMPWIAFLMGQEAYELHRNGDSEQAVKMTDHALGIAEDAADPLAQAQIWNQRGLICVESRRVHECEAAYTKALGFAREFGARSLENSIQTNLGNYAMYFRGDLKTAETSYLASRDFCLESGHVTDLAYVSLRLADLYLSMGEPQRALPHNDEAVRSARAGKLRGLEAKLLLQRSRIECLPAAERLESAAHGIRLAEDPALTREGWWRLAELLVREGWLEEALRATETAAQVPAGTRLAWHVSATRARALLLEGDHASARKLAEGLLRDPAGTSPAHRAALGAVLLHAACLAEIGPAGDLQGLPDRAGQLAAEVQACANDGYGEFAAMRDALQAAAQTQACLAEGPPYGLLMGCPPAALHPEQIASILRGTGAALRTANPKLYAEANARSRPSTLSKADILALGARAQPRIPEG